MKNLNKKKIVLDFDDTLVKSSEAIIEILNKRYGTTKTIKDLSDWGYRNIYHSLTEKELSEIFSSQEFFDTVQLNDGVKEFLEYAQDIYEIIICSKGTKQNLSLKSNYCLENNLCDRFIGIETNDVGDCILDKSSIDLSDTLFAVDDNTSALISINSNFKILITNGREHYWNRIPKNEDIYVIRNFKELLQICEFDEKLRKEGIWLGK